MISVTPEAPDGAAEMAGDSAVLTPQQGIQTSYRPTASKKARGGTAGPSWKQAILFRPIWPHSVIKEERKHPAALDERCSKHVWIEGWMAAVCTHRPPLEVTLSSTIPI